MNTIIRSAMLGLAVAAAQTAMAPTTANAQLVVTEPGGTVVAPLQLTPAQRTVIYRHIVRERAAPPPPVVSYRVGTRVPDAVALEPLPDTVMTEVPEVRSYRYVVGGNRVLLVDPTTSVVVGEAYE
jgi:Protein of unknown function (DUF1236)